MSESAAESVVLLARDGALAIVTLNRPTKLNALNRELRTEFCHTMQALRDDQSVGVVIITGAGRGFCAGLDLKELGADSNRESGAVVRDTTNVSFVSVIEDMTVPVIAAVNGFAITGGFELALACDIMLAAESAQFADTHARVGVMPGGGMSARLPRAVGLRKAKELSLTGNYLSAREAERLGLVNRVVPDDRLLTEARELAGQILSGDQNFVRQMKQLYDRTSRTTLEDALRIEQETFRAFNSSSKLSDFDRRREAVMQRGRSQTRS
ncbi:MAG TPA: enoyl-CoA hydratase [Candidatus Binataceae bacterium]|nr:enoyl-CoA hydratase [Candidatus Binataceae bacterium]